MAKPKSMCDLADHLVAEVTDARGVFRWCFACGAVQLAGCWVSEELWASLTAPIEIHPMYSFGQEFRLHGFDAWSLLPGAVAWHSIVGGIIP